MKRSNIRHWHSTHNDWLRALKFYKEEISILSDRLTEIAGKNTAQEASAGIEHFQNQFILHRDNEEQLEHDIRLNLEQISKEAESQTGFVSDHLLEELKQKQRDFLQEEINVNLLRHEFNNFSATWM